MRATIYCAIPADADQELIVQSIESMQAQVAEYVPGYRLSTDPVFEPGRVAVFVEVEGAGDYLPTYAGNLDIMTAAAVRVGEQLAQLRMDKGASA
jgi:acetaldehyde dehydrogenase